MSDKKKVIYVKDLVIKADNVIIESSHHRDPFFGGRQRRVEDVEEQRTHHRDEERDEHENKHRHNHDDHEEKKHDDRPPFSWL